MRKTVLFHVNNFLAGGIEKVLLEVLHALDAERYRVILSIAYDLGAAEALLPQVPAHVEIRRVLDKPWMNYVRRQKTGGHIGPLAKVFWEAFLPFFIRREHRRKYAAWGNEADVVIDFDTTLAPYVDVLRGPRTAAYCHFAFGTMWDGRPGKLARLARRLAQYDTVVMLCDEMRDEAAALFPALAPKLRRLYNALDFDRVRALAAEDPEGMTALRQTGYVVSVGRLQAEQKDFSTVIRAYAAAVRESGLPQHLVIVGDGNDRAALESLAAAEGLRDRIHFTGFQANPYPWMAGADAFLFGSKYEGLPTVLIEAQALGLPIVATACPTGVRELLAYGEAGILVPVGDDGAMKTGLLQLLDNEALRARFRARSQELVRQFDMQRVIREFERIVLGMETPGA